MIGRPVVIKIGFDLFKIRIVRHYILSRKDQISIVVEVIPVLNGQLYNRELNMSFDQLASDLGAGSDKSDVLISLTILFL